MLVGERLRDASGRPWQATPDEEAREGMWADYAAFERWWQEAVEDSLCEGEPSIWDGMNTIQQAHLYVVLAKLFDARDAGPRPAPPPGETGQGAG